MKQTILKILTALMNNSKTSDREIANKVGVSQPTVTRCRARLVDTGIIKHYAVIPDLKKLGYTMITISEIPNNATLTPTGLDKLIADPKTIFAMKNPKTIWVLSRHKDFKDFNDFFDKYGAVAAHHATTDNILKDPAVTSP